MMDKNNNKNTILGITIEEFNSMSFKEQSKIIFKCSYYIVEPFVQILIGMIAILIIVVIVQFIIGHL